MIAKEEIRYWAALVAAVLTNVLSAVAIPHPYDKVLGALSAAAMAVATFHMTPPRQKG